MARTNKYTSVNFNDIYEKQKIPTSPSSSLSSRLSNGGMLVLSRPSPKPTSSPPLSPSLSSLASTPPPSKSPHSHFLSPLPHPQANTPSPAPPNLERENNDTSPLPKTDKFVPPHLRPGYVARDHQAHVPPESLRPGGLRPGNFRPGSGHGDGRPNSGGGYDRRMRAVGGPNGESDLLDLNRPRSGGSRPSTSG